MQVKSFIIKSIIALLLSVSASSVASAGCRTETRFNEFTRTWSTNDVCDFGTLPSYNSYVAPAYVAPAYIAPAYVVPVVTTGFTWNFPNWIWSTPTYVDYTIPATVPAATYLDSGVLSTPIEYWDHSSSSWLPGWLDERVDRFSDSWGNFFLVW